jgi:K+ transporter
MGLVALGVVFGDIGRSPLCALKTCSISTAMSDR